MREILFRGKRIDNGEWVDGAFLNDGDSAFYICPVVSDISYGDHGNRIRIGCWRKVEPSTVGQFTGMTDKNGKRIFEGDILRIVLTDGHEDGPIVWSDIDARYHFESPDGCSYGICEWNDLEVIGNIHDNPELLNGGDAG